MSETSGQPKGPSSSGPNASEAKSALIPASIPQQSAGAVPPPFEHKTPWTAYIRPILWTIVALYVITFVFLNREVVVINFLFFQASVPLIFVLVGLALLGAALAAGVMAMTRRRATKKAEYAAAQAALHPKSGK